MIVPCTNPRSVTRCMTPAQGMTRSYSANRMIGSSEKKLHGLVPAGFDPNPSLIFRSSFRVGCEGQGAEARTGKALF